MLNLFCQNFKKFNGDEVILGGKFGISISSPSEKSSTKVFASTIKSSREASALDSLGVTSHDIFGMDSGDISCTIVEWPPGTGNCKR